MERRGFFAALAGAVIGALGLRDDSGARASFRYSLKLNPDLDVRSALASVERRFQEHNERMAKMPRRNSIDLRINGKAIQLRSIERFSNHCGVQMTLKADGIGAAEGETVALCMRDGERIYAGTGIVRVAMDFAGLYVITSTDLSESSDGITWTQRTA